ncbi:MAG: hypothetical protein LBN22_05620 [Clostridiales Family XIII bacterium]|jgi:hypothetical protein|nr:hypothetical protein [Clostridiales Family XIII bacterium]
MRNTINEFDIANFAAPMKYSFVAVMNDEGYPHMNLITSLEGRGEKEIVFARNYAGETKNLLEEKKDAGFMSLGLDMNFWSGKMRLREIENEGELMAYYNSKPSSRYNTYFTCLSVYLNDLIGIEGPTPINVAAIGSYVQQVLPQMPTLVSGGEDGPITSNMIDIITRQTTAKFICWQGEDGIPEFAPLFGAIPAGSARMAFALEESADRLAGIPDGAKVTLHMIDAMTVHAIQVRGEYHQTPDGLGYIDVKQVYNPMAPRPSIVYPRVPYAAVTEF